jgi:hypothetical protein
MRLFKVLTLFVFCLVACGGGDSGNSGNGSSGSSSFTKSIETVDNADSSGHGISIAVDKSGNPGISNISSPNSWLFYISVKQSGSWVRKSVNTGISSLYSGTAITVSSAGQFSGIFSQNSGTASASTAVRYDFHTSGLTQSTLDSNTAKIHTVAATDKNDVIHVAYQNGSTSALTYAKYVSGAWASETVGSSAITGEYPAIAVDSASKAHIVYFDPSEKSMKYATNKSGSWVISVLDSTINSKNSSYAYDSNDDNYWSVAVDSNDAVHVSYYHFTDDSLKYTTNASGSWVTTVVDKSSKGKSSSIGIDSKNKLHISYYNQSIGALRYATNKSGSWSCTDIDSPTALTSHIGAITSLAVDPSDNIHIAYQYYSEPTASSNSMSLKYVKLTY